MTNMAKSKFSLIGIYESPHIDAIDT